MLEKLRVQWPWVLSGLVILAAIATPVIAPRIETLSHLGDFLAGFAAALAFIWLIAAYRLQQYPVHPTLHRQRDTARVTFVHHTARA